jgi:hypothetical protein
MWLPPVGWLYLILKGDADKDIRRMGLVLWQTKSVVAIVWQDAKRGATIEK